ncbi:MAG: transcriptional regulator [Sphingopyxis sp.]|nr:transcriptional regulator [Sphingopyxis sp.]
MTMDQTITRAVFGDGARRDFAALYPETPGPLRHHLAEHDLLSIDALAALGEALPADQVEYNQSLLPVGIAPDDIPTNGLGIGETIRTIAANQSWAALKNIEAMPEYRALLMDLLGELAATVESRTGPMLTPQGFIFISSPRSITPFHFDPEHNLLLNIRGDKVMHVWPGGDERFAPAREHERYHSGGHRNLRWDQAFAGHELAVPLGPGDAVHMPVMAPHYVEVGDAPALSLSITWRSEWSYREAEAHAANRWLRRFGIDAPMPPRWPRHARGRSTLWRVLRRLGAG